MEAFTPAGPTGCRIFLVSGTATGYTAYDPAATLATEMQVLHEDLPTLNTLDPLEVPFEREQYELSVEADRYTLATRRAFVEFMRDAGAAVEVAVDPASGRASPKKNAPAVSH
jgi:hypothetical protein